MNSTVDEALKKYLREQGIYNPRTIAQITSNAWEQIHQDVDAVLRRPSNWNPSKGRPEKW